MTVASLNLSINLSKSIVTINTIGSAYVRAFSPAIEKKMTSLPVIMGADMKGFWRGCQNLPTEWSQQAMAKEADAMEDSNLSGNASVSYEVVPDTRLTKLCNPHRVIFQHKHTHDYRPFVDACLFRAT